MNVLLSLYISFNDDAGRGVKSVLATRGLGLSVWPSRLDVVVARIGANDVRVGIERIVWNDAPAQFLVEATTSLPIEMEADLKRDAAWTIVREQ